MADEDLDSFFAKKKSKKRPQKGVQNLDVLAQKLEQTVKLEQELDKEEEEEHRLGVKDEPRAPIEEDSEWLEPVQPGDVDMTAVNIKELALNDDERSVDDEEKENQGTQKTWNMSRDAEEGPPVVEEAPKEQKPSKYIAPGRAKELTKPGKSIDIQNNMEFPSLSLAAQLETAIEKKKTPATKRTPWKQPDRSASPAEAVVAEQPKRDTAHSPMVEHKEVPVAPQPAAVAGAPTKPAYVPPHLRGKQ